MVSDDEVERILRLADDDIQHIMEDPRKAYAVDVIDTLLSDGAMSSERHTELWLLIRGFQFNK